MAPSVAFDVSNPSRSGKYACPKSSTDAHSYGNDTKNDVTAPGIGVCSPPWTSASILRNQAKYRSKYGCCDVDPPSIDFNIASYNASVCPTDA